MTTFDPGIHPNVPAAAYHAADGVSNSMLKIFANHGPAHLRAAMAGEPEDDSETNPDERDARVLGTLAHLAILEPDRWGNGLSHHRKPTHYQDAKTGEMKKWAGNAKVCQEWMEAHADLPTLSAKNEGRIVGARAAVMAHPFAGPLLAAPGSNEASVFAHDPPTGLTLRIRPDRLTEDVDGRPWAADLKTCPSVAKFAYSAREFRYDIQCEFYRRVLGLAGVANPGFIFIAVELAPTYGIHAVRCYEVERDTAAAAAAQIDEELERLAHCIGSGAWPLGGAGLEPLRVRRFVP